MSHAPESPRLQAHDTLERYPPGVWESMVAPQGVQNGGVLEASCPPASRPAITGPEPVLSQAGFGLGLWSLLPELTLCCLLTSS